MKKLRHYFILLILIFPLMLTAEDTPSGADELEELKAMAKEMSDLWGERVCASDVTHRYEETVVSIACNAEYQSAERDRMLDYLFKKGYFFRGESYNVKGTTGHYWYKLGKKEGSRTRNLFIRLHITSQGALWGSVKPPTQIALYVDYLSSSDELTAWQTLGVPVTFGLKVSEGAKELLQQLEEYKQEAWVSLDLRQGTFSEPDQTASIRDIIEQDLIAPHIKNAIESTGEVMGFVMRDLNNITTTVASARAIFNAMKAEGKTMVLLPARHNAALSTTANVMGMNNRAVTYDMTMMCKKDPGKIWSFLKSKTNAGGIIVRFQAKDKRCAYRLSRTMRRDGKLEYKKLSSIFGYNPARTEGRGD
ncbi:MAG TPA: hypothetical protein PLY93_07780 [Turneriella sp.]|nr:hypothetical protein [Turneriella sp.]